MSSLGVFVSAGDTVALDQFETWLGADVQFLSANGGRAGWSDWLGSLTWLGQKFASVDATLNWTIPMFANGGTLAAASNGDYNSYYVKAAQALVDTSTDDEKIYVRVGEEFNGSWEPWYAKGHEQEFIQTFRNFVTAFRSVSDKFVFEWNVNVGGSGMDPATAYPGDDYVDIIGMDFYYDKRWDSPDPVKAWNYMVSRKWGLQWLEDFADVHDKPTAYSEWGVDSDNAGAYIEKAFQWFEAHDVVHQNYWNSNAAFAGMLSQGAHPGTAAAYKTLFSTLGHTEPPLVTAPSPAPATPAVTVTPPPLTPTTPTSPSETPGTPATTPDPAPAIANPNLVNIKDELLNVMKADPVSTTSVVSLSYQFFTGKIPGASGIEYFLTNDSGNMNNLNGEYYEKFSTVNRYINFAVNLGKEGEGKAWLQETYGSLSLFEATREAYKVIFGSSPTDAKVHAMLDPRADYLSLYGGDGVDGIGTKAAMVGFLLSAAATEHVGVMSKANDAWLQDVADGSAPFAVSLLDKSWGYYHADFIFGG